MAIIDIYCDGSISQTRLLDPFQSQLHEEYVARLIVLIPSYDLGMIERTTRPNILTRHGTPDSVFVETLAIDKAIEFCISHAIREFVIYSDCKSAVEAKKDSRIRWASRKDMYRPNAFFDRIRRRASYLRQTEGQVKQRRPLEPHQQEIFDLLQAEQQEFQLSKSQLWARILRDEKRWFCTHK